MPRKLMNFGLPSIQGVLIMWLRPKGLKVYLYVKSMLISKIQTHKKSAGT